MQLTDTALALMLLGRPALASFCGGRLQVPARERLPLRQLGWRGYGRGPEPWRPRSRAPLPRGAPRSGQPVQQHAPGSIELANTLPAETI